MRRYVQLSGVVFGLLAAVQLIRFLTGWPVNVAHLAVPAWVSGLAFLIAGSFAFWAWRLGRSAG